MAHRVAWLLHYGEWPAGVVDHIDGDPSNNKIENLRIVTQQQNVWNSKKRYNNTSGTTGVLWRKKERKWYASLRVSGQTISLGFFDNKEAAIAAREGKEIEIHGKFRRQNAPQAGG